jgi:hypothetical protein
MIVMISPVSNDMLVRSPSPRGGHPVTRHALTIGFISLGTIVMVIALLI